MPLQATSGAASYDAFGGGVPIVPNYIEDVFSTYLYTGNGSTQTITNNIDITGKGALVWLKRRTGGTGYHVLTDTSRGAGYNISTNDTIAEYNDGQPTFNSNGFNLINNNPDYNASASTYASWTFRKQPKFFDIVTYTGNGTAGRTVAHNLGSVPGFIVIKRLDFTSAWPAIHRGNGTNWQRFWLNQTSAGATPPNANWWGDGTSFIAPTSTNFTLGTNSEVNTSSSTYVAYLFAHNAGGFGLTGTDNVISCGSYTGTGNTSLNVNLGYEPQWVMIKNATTEASSTGWYIQDNMRGMSASTDDNGVLYANLSSAEAQKGSHIVPTATGFTCSASDADFNSSGVTYIYIAIRRGPMKVPTSGTSVFSPLSVTPVSGPTTTFTTNFPVDLLISKNRQYESNNLVIDRLRGSFQSLITNGTRAEETGGSGVLFDSNVKAVSTVWGTGFGPIIGWNFRRAPSFFDEVCYTGNYYVGTDFQAVSHNLAVVPELAIIKRRSTVKAWNVYYGNVSQYMELQSTAAESSAGDRFDSTSPTATTFYVGADSDTNSGGITYVMYLFATCAGVSKVGSYTGTGTTLQIDCGFTGGARFVLIKRKDSTGDWYVWDSARGIVSGNDPYSLLNSDVAEVTSTDYIDTYSAGFEISSTAPAAINASGGTFIFLAIA